MSNPLKDLGLEDLQSIAQVRRIKDFKAIKYHFSIRKSKKSKNRQKTKNKQE